MVFTDMIRLSRFYKGRFFTGLPSGRWGGIYALPMGALLALSFCPATAALFFGLLIPLAIQHGQIILFPVLYGMGAFIPLISLVILIIQGKKRIMGEKWQKTIPLIAGWLLIITGIVLSLLKIY
jgi:cytochrome c biogenesis protein CcdA